MYFGLFGSIFLLTQFFQTAQGYSPLEAGPADAAVDRRCRCSSRPIAGALSDRIGGRPLMAIGLALQAIGLGWIAVVSRRRVAYASLVGPFVVAGIGMGLFFAPVANAVLGAVRPEEEGKASGATNAIRELGGVFGVAVLASIFSHAGGFASPQDFVDGLEPAIWVGAAVVAVGAVAALAIPGVRRSREPSRAVRPVAEPDAA